MVTAVDATQTAGEWFGPFTAVVGHSFGGAVAVNAAVGSVPSIKPLATDRLVLIASPNSMSDVFEGFGRFVNLGRRTYSAMAGQVQRISGQTLSKFTGSRLLANLPIPTLVVHAADDREVPADDARALASAGDHVRLHWADGLGHRRILSDPAIVELSVGFVTERREPALVH
jgi:pimeloyl-ACP methyl ester carboxylesterase